MSKHRTHGIWNRLVSGLLCLALVLGLMPATGLVQPAEAAHWADPYGQQLVEWGVMRGDISGNLNLNNPITRAEFVTMCNRAFGYDKLGTMPFTDVPSSQWYAQDINIAYNAGYFKGTSDTTASPMSALTREQAAVLLARNLMLRETAGESLGFTDSRILNEWSRGLIAAAVSEGMLTGYSDGSFRPFNNITRGEVAAMLVRVIGTPIDEAGNHELGNVYGNVTISESNVTLRNTTIVGNLYLTGGIDLGNVLLENVTVLGRIVVSGAGESNASQSSILLRNVEADEMVVDSLKQQFVTIRAQGVTDIPSVSVRSDAYLDDSSWPGYGLHYIELDGEAGTKLQLAGNIKEVVNKTPSSDLQLVQGSAEKVTIDEYAKNSQVLVDTGTRMDELNLDVATLVTGKGDIKDLNVGAAGSEVDILPDSVVIRPGITATIDGEEMGSVDASELSSEPRLLAGYPTVTGIAPTEAEGLFSGNKPGTIYWAISSLADGSVSEEDLIKNPAYGGNIFAEQAGSIDASNPKTEYARQITNLLPDGSYYISAIMVDGRGKRSPVKVAAFATPDDTVPAFVGTPTMTKTTTTVAQVTATANKSCLLYWAVLAAGASAPTPQEFKTASVGGNYGYGSLSVVKNVPTSITVNRNRLQEKTTYELYLWLTDHNGAQSMAAPVRITFTTPDETPPIVTAPIQTDYGESTAEITFSMNEAPSTLYWAVVAEGNESFIAPGADADETAQIMSDLRTKIKVESGAGALVNGSAPVATAYADVVFTISNLITANTHTNNYTLYYVGKDAAGNYSDQVRSISIQTLDTTPPTVKQEFTVYNGDKVNEPLADTGVRLVFSEQVKGGANAKETFLELYNKTVDTSVSEATREDARNTLARELAAHIRLYNVPRAGSGSSGPQMITPRSDEDSKNNTNTPWVLDFHKAVVTQEPNGNVVIFLPGDGDDGYDPALKLDSGATYYFQLLGVFDNAFNPNGVHNEGLQNPQGNWKLDNFTTVYAQVNIEWNTNITTVTQPTGVTDTDGINGRRIDICVDVKPTSTSKVADTECWDMILWSDTWMEIEIYRQDIGEGSNGEWKLLNKTAAVPINDSPGRGGIGLGTEVISGGVEVKYPVLPDTLEEEHTYRYGIHVTKIGTVGEGTDKTAEASTWGNLVTMHFALIAGGRGDVQGASIGVDSTFDSDFNIIQTPQRVSYISTVYDESGVKSVLEVPKQFRDTKVPSFQSGYPQFKAGSGTIHMDVDLDRAGTVYYVVAPAGTISTRTTVNGNPISESNHGAENATTKTYIPKDGEDRDAKKEYIYFASGGGSDANGFIRGVYYLPSYGDITRGNFPSTVYVPREPLKYTNTVTGVDITGLMPKTWYYIYTVLEGGGAPDRVVEIYRVQTEDIKTPAIDIKPSGTTGVTMTVNNVNTGSGSATKYDNSMLAYALVEWNSLPSMFMDLYTWKSGGGKFTGTTIPSPNTDNVMSVLDAMITPLPGGTGKTYFDEFGGETGINLKDSVMQYISSTTGDVVGYVPTHRYPFTQENPKAEDCTEYMTSNTSEYVVLACARHQYGTNTGASYGFAAARGLYKPDLVPPEFTADMPLYAATITKATKTDGTEDKGWQFSTDAPYYSFDGKITLSFSKAVYYVQQDASGNRVRKQIWNKDPSAMTAAEKAVAVSILDVLGGTGKAKFSIDSDDVRTGAVDTFTLTFTGLRTSDRITLSNLGNNNNQSNPNPKTLTMIFDAALKTSDYYETHTPMAAPGFRVTWQ